MADFQRPCGCTLRYECDRSRELFQEAREAWATGGLPAYNESLHRWQQHRAGHDILALLEKSVELRTVPPLGLRTEGAPCSVAGCEGGVLTLNRMSLPCPRCRKEAGK